MKLVLGLTFLLLVPVFGVEPCLTEIRIANRSEVAIEDIRVQFPSQEEVYGTILPKGVSDYRVVKKAYRYARIEAVVGGEPALLQPFDYLVRKSWEVENIPMY